MSDKTELDKIPSRIKYYLLEWKDQNMEEYVEMYGARLHDLTNTQLKELFDYATNKDKSLLLEILTY